MAQGDPPGYPLPSGVLGADEIVCQLVYLPDRPEYWQALLAAVHYFSTWKAWERDDDKRGKDAASDWRDAFELTMECWRMTCLDDITDRMDLIIDLISLKKDCCDDNVTYDPQVQVETEIDPNEGDPPDFYGETAVTDWEDWAEHVCYNAHLYVDILVFKATEIDTATTAAAITVGVIAAALAALSFVGIGLAIGYGLATLTAGEVLAALVQDLFSSSASDIEDSRDDIVCALLLGYSLSDAVEAALSGGLDWQIFFSQVDYDSATAIIYEGGHNGEYLPSDVSGDCEICDYQQLTDQDVHVGEYYGSVTGYDEGTAEWTYAPQGEGPCYQARPWFFEDDTETTPMLVRIELTSCTGSPQCSTNPKNRGFLHPDVIWSFSEPHLPTIAEEPVNMFSHLHPSPADNYVMTFKLWRVP